MTHDHLNLWREIESGAAKRGLDPDSFVSTTAEGAKLGRKYNDAIRVGVEAIEPDDEARSFAASRPRGHEVEQPHDVWAEIETLAERYRSQERPTLAQAVEYFTTETSQGRELVARWRALSGIDESIQPQRDVENIPFKLLSRYATEYLESGRVQTFADGLDLAVRVHPEPADAYSRWQRG